MATYSNDFEQSQDDSANEKRVSRLRSICATCPKANTCPMLGLAFITRESLCHRLRNASRINHAFTAIELAGFLSASKQ